MLLHMVDDAALRPDAAVVLQNVEYQPRALQFVLEMRRVDKDELLVAGGQVHVHFEHPEFIARVLVQPDLADAEHVWCAQELRNEVDDLRGELNILRFLGLMHNQQ